MIDVQTLARGIILQPQMKIYSTSLYLAGQPMDLCAIEDQVLAHEFITVKIN